MRHMSRSSSGWRFTMRLPRPFRDILKNDSAARSLSPFVRASFGPLTVRNAAVVGEVAAARCRLIYAEGSRRREMMDNSFDANVRWSRFPRTVG